MNDALYEINEIYKTNYNIPDDKIDLTDFNKEIRISLSNIFSDIKKTVTKRNVLDIFDENKYRLLYLLDYIQRKVYWYSYIKVGALIGIEDAYILFNSKDDEEEHESKINTNDFSIEDVPSYHSFCKCKVTYKKEKVVSN